MMANMTVGASAGTPTPTKNTHLSLGSFLGNGGARAALCGGLGHVPSGDGAPDVGSGALRHRHHLLVDHVRSFLVGAVGLLPTYYATVTILVHTFGTSVRHAGVTR